MDEQPAPPRSVHDDPAVLGVSLLCFCSICTPLIHFTPGVHAGTGTPRSCRPVVRAADGASFRSAHNFFGSPSLFPHSHSRSRSLSFHSPFLPSRYLEEGGEGPTFDQPMPCRAFALLTFLLPNRRPPHLLYGILTWYVVYNVIPTPLYFAALMY